MCCGVGEEVRMARGNWRSGKGHGPAEVGSRQREFDGRFMRVSSTCDNEAEAKRRSAILEKDGYRTEVTKGRIHWTVWRTYHREKK